MFIRLPIGKPYRLLGVVGLSLLALLNSHVATSQADVTAIGDISPFVNVVDDFGDPVEDAFGEQYTAGDLPRFGGPVTAEVDDGMGGTTTESRGVIVGGTGSQVAGSDMGQLIIDQPGITDRLESSSGIIGDMAVGQGLVTITGINSEWRYLENFVVADEGQGILDLLNGGRVRAGALVGSTPPMGSMFMPSIGTPDFMVAQELDSVGEVLVDGFGSLLHSSYLVVGGTGHGDMVVSDRAVVRTEETGVVGREGIGDVLVTGRSSAWHVNELAIGQDGDGGSSDVGQGYLEIVDHGLVSAMETIAIATETDALANVVVGSLGTLAAAGASTSDDDAIDIGAGGTVTLAGGTVRAPGITNAGAIIGSGILDAEVSVTTGYVRNGASTANLREKLVVTGAVTNSGIIESVGGEMEFHENVTVNADGTLLGDDAIFRFNSGYVNNGNTLMKESIIHMASGATFTNVAALTVDSGATTINGSMMLDATGTLTLELDDDQARLVVADDVTLGGTLVLDLADGFLPTPGETIEILSADSISGMFDTETPNANFDYTVEYEAMAVYLNITAVDVDTSIPTDFNDDGSVDGLDLDQWQMDYGMNGDSDADGDGDSDGLDFLTWQRVASGGTAATPAVNAVPEPSSLLLVTGLLAGLGLRRQR